MSMRTNEDPGTRRVAPVCRTNEYVHIVLVLLLLVVAGLQACEAADTTLPFPSGWFASPSSAPYAMAADAIAVALQQGEAATDVSRVTQFRGFATGNRTVVHTDLPGYVGELEYSIDGTWLLAHQVIPGAPAGSHIRVTLLDAGGTVLWTRDGRRVYHFSGTGERLFSLAYTEGLGAGLDAQIFDLAGQFEKTIQFDRLETPSGLPTGRTMSAFLLLGTGESAIAATDHVAMRLSVGATPSKMWSVCDTRADAPRIVNVYPLDSDDVVLELTRGFFKIVDVAAGTVRVDFDPAAFAAADSNPAHDRDFWSGYLPFTGPTPGTATLFDHRSDTVYTLNLATGELTGRPLDRTTPAGSVLRERIHDQKIVIIGPQQVRIRSLAP